MGLILRYKSNSLWSKSPPLISNMCSREGGKALLLRTTTILSTITDLKALCHLSIVRKKNKIRTAGIGHADLYIAHIKGLLWYKDDKKYENTLLEKIILNVTVNLGNLNMPILPVWNNLLLIMHHLVFASVDLSMWVSFRLYIWNTKWTSHVRQGKREKKRIIWTHFLHHVNQLFSYFSFTQSHGSFLLEKLRHTFTENIIRIIEF